MRKNLLTSAFRIIACLEGLSYIFLLIAVPIKYILKNEYYVQILGMPHGILFILYIVLAFLLQKQMKWRNSQMIIIILASVVPFGTFYVDYKYLK